MTERSLFTIVLCLLVIGAVAGGIAMGDTGEADLGGFEVDSPETAAADVVADEYGEEDALVSQVVVREEGGDVLTRDSIRDGLRLQQEARQDPDVNQTLDERGFLGIENLVGYAAYFQADEGGTPGAEPTLDEQIEAIDALSDEAFEELLLAVLDSEDPLAAGADPFALLPSDYEPGSTESPARLTLVFQVDDSSTDEQPEAAYDGQLALADMVEERFTDAFVFGEGVRDAASSQATGDSFAIITPVALLIVVLVLGVAYRDAVDIVLALAGIGAVLAMLFGLMGWLQIPMNVILIAVPFLLVGLSIDYALHVVMRYREARLGRLDGRDADGRLETGQGSDGEERRSIRRSMGIGLASVIVALAAATFSTGVGFFSNVVSPLPAIRDFAVLSAGGIVATLLVFGVLLPALKLEVDQVLESRVGVNRVKEPFGVGRGIANRGLEGVATLASRAPVAVIVIAILLATGGAIGATTIDTEFNDADFLPENPPDAASYLPGPLEPDEYTIAGDFAYLNERFQIGGPDDRVTVLIQGDLLTPELLAALDERTEAGADAESALANRADGSLAVDGPHTVLRDVAAENDRLASAIDDRDETGNGLPDREVDEVIDLLFEVDEVAAADVIAREDGETTSVRLLVSVDGTASTQTIRDDAIAFATGLEEDVDGIEATPTGQPVTEAVIQDALLENLVQAFTITLVVILTFLTALFWRSYGSVVLGGIILAPIIAALAWLLGAMAILGIPFNSETAVITSLAIGLGVDYSIHAGERFLAERERVESIGTAVKTTITGTGGALLASAGTTAAGFGVLSLALVPSLQRFGIVTASAILLAFVASVVVLPCLLVVRERFQAARGG